MQPSKPQRPVMDISAPQRPGISGVSGRPAPRPAAQIPGQDETSSASAAPAKVDALPEAAAPQAQAPAAPVATTPPKPDDASDLFEKPAPSLPVHEAPHRDDEPDSQPADADAGNGKTEADTPAEPTEEPAKQPKPQLQKPHDKAPLPAGAITGAVLLMLALSTVAVLIYLNSQ